MKRLTEMQTQARGAMADVSDASRRIVQTTEWATVALVAVAAVSVLALGVAVVALKKAGS